MSDDVVICTSKIPGAMRELAVLLQKEFGLKEEEVSVHVSYSDSLTLRLTSDVSIDEIKAYCSGFVDALDITEYLTTEYLNDR